MRLAAGIRGRCRDRKGQALAEMAIVLPVLLLLVFGIIELSMAWRGFQVVTNSAREGARVLIIPGMEQPDVVTRIAQSMQSGGLPLDDESAEPGDQIGIECLDAGTGQPVAGGCFGPSRSGSEGRIRIEYPYTFRMLGPIVQYACAGACPGGFGTITLASTSTMRIE